MVECLHPDRPAAGRVCRHLYANSDAYIQRFTGTGTVYDLICGECGKNPGTVDEHLISICAGCLRGLEESESWEGTLGNPEIRIGSSDLRFEHQDVEIPALLGLELLNIQPIETTSGRWLACTSKGLLIEIDVVHRSTRSVAQITPEYLDFEGEVLSEINASWKKGPRCVLKLSRCGTIAAIANTYGSRGVVIDLTTGNATMQLHRGKYHADVCVFPIAFSVADNIAVIVHASDWNRLDASNAKTGELITKRGPTSCKQGEERPPHYLDYFHCDLSVSSDDQFIADNGWVWHPFGVVTSWSISNWLRSNPWESEDGTSYKRLCWRGYFWDGPLCWIGNRKLAVWGYGQDDEELLPAVMIFEVETGIRERWFAGPIGSLWFDDYLFSSDSKVGTAVWNVESGERLLLQTGLHPSAYHREEKKFCSLMGNGVIRLSTLQKSTANKGLVDWLLKCPVKGYFVPIESESTETIG